MDLDQLTKQPSEVKEMHVMGDRLLVLKDGASTAGRYAVIHQFLQPGGGPPPHVHTREDEVFFVVDGEFDILLGDSTIHAPKGAVVDAPRNVRHTFKCVGDQPGSILFLCYPAGVEKFFDAASRLEIPKELPKLFEIAKQYGLLFEPGKE